MAAEFIKFLAGVAIYSAAYATANAFFANPIGWFLAGVIACSLSAGLKQAFDTERG